MFPPAFWEQEYGAALFPFQLRAFYATSAFRRSLMNDDGTLQGRVNLGRAATAGPSRPLLAYELILERTYGIDLGVDVPVIFTTVGPRHEAGSALPDCSSTGASSRSSAVGPVPPLADAVRRRLQTGRIDARSAPRALAAGAVRPARLHDREGRRRHRPGGAVLAQARPHRQGVDRVERPLPEPAGEAADALPAARRCAWAWPPSRATACSSSTTPRATSTRASSRTPRTTRRPSSRARSTSGRSVEGRPVIIDDLAAWPDRTRIEDELIAERRPELRLRAAPLPGQGDRHAGAGLAHAGDLNATHLPKLEEVLPLFSMAVQRSVEELNSAHPGRHQGEVHGDPPDGRVALPQGRAQRPRAATRRHARASAPRWSRSSSRACYPLYGLADIRGSSTQRGLAIQADLLDPAPPRRAP